MRGSSMPEILRTCPMRGEWSLVAEHSTWRLHRVLRGRDFDDVASYQRFLESQSGPMNPALPADASPADQAQELFYQSRAADSGLNSRLLRRDGLALDPDNVDLRVDSAVLDKKSEFRRGLLEKAVALADVPPRERSSPEADDERGWIVLSHRPGLRARAALALEYIDCGRLQDALDVCGELLARDPRDAIGARYQVVSLQLELGQLEGARLLLAAYRTEPNAILAWARLLLTLLEGGDAEEALRHARGLNAKVEARLLAPEVMEPPFGGSSAANSLEEAELIGDLLWRAWHAHARPLKWLRARAESEDLREEPSEPVWERILRFDEDGLREGVVPHLLPVKSATVRRLKELLIEGLNGRDRYVAEGAARLLSRTGAAAEAVPELIAQLCAFPGAEPWSEREACWALGKVGRAAVRPLLKAHATERSADARFDLGMALALTRHRDTKVLAVLVKELEADAVLGSILLGEYGDAAALPFLHDRLGGMAVDAGDPEEGTMDLIETIEELGGTFSAEQQVRFGASIEASAHWRSPEGRAELQEVVIRAIEGDEEDPLSEAEDTYDGSMAEDILADFAPRLPRVPASESALARPRRLGRNAPCWCGSEKKYKRCHMADDDRDLQGEPPA